MLPDIWEQCFDPGDKMCVCVLILIFDFVLTDSLSLFLGTIHLQPLALHLILKPLHFRAASTVLKIGTLPQMRHPAFLGEEKIILLYNRAGH